ncbi:MAG: hypothetical protein LBC76_05915 [Treponema sp.]|jgi:hypothetical protein|nr:hypothetical protein [Treponema sp.]
MNFTVKKYLKVKELANDIKCALNSYNNQVMFHLINKKLTRGELKQFLGKTLDDDNNRALAFIGGSLCKTMRSIFTQKKTGGPRKTLFINLLLEYDREVYGKLLADMNT